MTDGPGQAVDHCFLIFVHMAVAVGDAMLVHIGVVMGMIFHSIPSFCSVFSHYSVFSAVKQARRGDIWQEMF
jgi:hypothetical protein